jgi:hypothetical protein
VNAACGEQPCVSARALANTRCEVCLQPIGYGRQILMRVMDVGFIGDVIAVRHRSCLSVETPSPPYR